MDLLECDILQCYKVFCLQARANPYANKATIIGLKFFSSVVSYLQLMLKTDF